MFNGDGGIIANISGAILFPLLFQGAFIDFVWGAGDEMWIMLGKRVFLLLPALAIVLGCWVSIGCVLTTPFRQHRSDYLTNLLITWWDLGRSIVTFWGGILRFSINLFVTSFWLLKFAALGLWSIVQEIIFMPIRAIRAAGHNVITSRAPWIAVNLTVMWCVIEAFIFTYVLTPLVLDTFSNITGEQLELNMVRIPLFIFLFFMILGSYAVLSTFVASVKSKRISSIIGIGVIEIVVLFVEVVFLYREFVDSLVPWFAQYSENFELGIFGTLAISGFVWFGIRSLSWFLFAEHGTPTIMSIIQGKGLETAPHSNPERRQVFNVSFEFLEKMKEEASWFQKRGEEFLASFMLPPLQVVAASINFCTLLLSGNHLFELPFADISKITSSSLLLRGGAKKKSVPVQGQSPQSARPAKPAPAPSAPVAHAALAAHEAPRDTALERKPVYSSGTPLSKPSADPSTGEPQKKPQSSVGDYRNA